MAAINRARFLSPSISFPQSTSPGFSNHSIDASNEGVAFVFRAKDANAITHLGFRYGARTGTPPTYIIGLESASATTGFPDGAYKTNGGNCSGAFTPPASTAWDGTWQWVALDNSYTPIAGELLVFTVRYSTGTIDVSNFSSFTTELANMGQALGAFPYGLRNTSGTWATRSNPVFGVRTASTRYGQIIQSLFATRTSSTIGHRAAMKFQIPAAAGDTYQVSGCRFCGDPTNAATGKNPTVRIWDAGGSLVSQSLDTEIMASGASVARVLEANFAPVTLTCGTNYYIGMQVEDAASAGVILRGIQAAAAEDLASDENALSCYSTFNGTSWTDDTTVRPWMELILDDWTEPTEGGGGTIVMPGTGFGYTGIGVS